MLYYIEGDDSMKRLQLICLVIAAVFTITGCTNEQLQEAIEQCKGDEECYLIIDDAITEELSARGISGGVMTNVELEQVYEIQTIKMEDKVIRIKMMSSIN